MANDTRSNERADLLSLWFDIYQSEPITARKIFEDLTSVDRPWRRTATGHLRTCVRHMQNTRNGSFLLVA
jgi:hypothetical protein